MPGWGPLASAVSANPLPAGLAGLDSWLWLDPAPSKAVLNEKLDGVEYRIEAEPVGATWDFGDGTIERDAGPQGFGVAFPQRSTVAHVFQADSRLGYVIGASVTYQVSWSAFVGASWLGPYPMGTIARAATPLVYPVQQAQPEILLM